MVNWPSDPAKSVYKKHDSGLQGSFAKKKDFKALLFTPYDSDTYYGSEGVYNFSDKF
jgi:hypothetical protein